ncbi:dipeptidase [Sphingomicrobium lutaoense]|uniref:Membrane dipeptidase n=1 Tax=Sphingomicrobium lutaoense TaxID=515949 RepID=A0A839Z0C7_9SPHN|nr:dipeptidase [Sphingomicrobium lutaoense]MBB3763025.1 membrane dipeptidase [Sphingomicrobium lutaoense]
MLDFIIAASLAAQSPLAPETAARIDRLLAETPLVDGHNDLPWAVRGKREFSVDELDAEPDLMTDMQRLKAGGVGAQLWSVYIPASVTGDAAVRTTLEQIDIADRLVATYPDTLAWARTADEIEAVHASGRIASLVGIEGGHQIGGNLAALRQFRKLGAIYMTLTHSRTTGWADSATDDPKHGGLSDFGKTVIGEMNRIGMLVDLSHVSEAAMHDALDTSRAPVIFSHSSARGVGAHPRNVPDSVLERLADNGGVVMVTFVPSFIEDAVWHWNAAKDAEEARLASLHTGDPDARAKGLEAWEAAHPRPETSVARVADHIDHIARVAGHDHVGIGGDFDGISQTIPHLDSVDDYPNLFAELMARGWSDAQLKGLAGDNFLRALRAAEKVAADMADLPPALGNPDMDD